MESNNDYIQEMEKRIEEEQTKIRDEKKGANNTIWGSGAFSLVFIILAYIMYKNRHMWLCNVSFWVFLILIIILVLILFSCIDDKKRVKNRELELQSLKEEYELEKIPTQNRMVRADKQFKINQKDLKRYYDMNLGQTKFLSRLGLFLVVFGLIIISISVGMYIWHGKDTDLLTIGCISGILVDFIGTVFISMYTHNMNMAKEFHAKLAASNEILLANSIANKIENEDLRERTLAEVSKEIIRIKE